MDGWTRVFLNYPWAAGCRLASLTSSNQLRVQGHLHARSSDPLITGTCPSGVVALRSSALSLVSTQAVPRRQLKSPHWFSGGPS